MDRIAGKRIDTEVTSVPNPNSIRYLGAVLHIVSGVQEETEKGKATQF